MIDPNLAYRIGEPRPGDVLGFSHGGMLGVTINLATLGVPFWGLSHVGIVTRQGDGKLLYNEQSAACIELLVVCESTVLAFHPCLATNRDVAGVQIQPLCRRLWSYQGKVWSYRLRRPLTAQSEEKLMQFCHSHLGKSYDAVGAFRARGAGFGWLEKRLRSEDLSSVFCSEFAAAALRHVGVFDTDNASRWNPNALCRALVRRGVVHVPVRQR